MNSRSDSHAPLPTKRGTLRTLSPVLSLIAASGLLYLLQTSVLIALLPLALACALSLCLWLLPSLYHRTGELINTGAQTIAVWLSLVISACVYAIVITPAALLLRMLGRDPLAVRSGGAISNWHPPYRKTYDDDFFQAQH